MKANIQVDGGPLDGQYTFDNYSPQNLNNTGLDQGSAEFMVWMMFDGAFTVGKGQVGYVSGGTTPATMQRQLAGETGFQAGPCNYWLMDWKNNDGEIVARFQHVDWPEVLRFRAARHTKARLEELNAKIEGQGGAPSMDLINALVAVVKAQQRQIELYETSPLIALWTHPKKA